MVEIEWRNEIKEDGYAPSRELETVGFEPAHRMLDVDMMTGRVHWPTDLIQDRDASNDKDVDLGVMHSRRTGVTAHAH